MTYLVVTGWLMSIFLNLKYQWLVAMLGLCLAGWLTRRQGGSLQRLWVGLAEPLAWWPFGLLILMIVAAGLMYPPTMLDSLTYRLPRIVGWMEQGHISFFQGAEDRMNFMPHCWELCVLPLIQLAGDHLVWLWSFLSWILLCLVTYDWAIESRADKAQARAMALIAATTTYAVLQAESSANDMFATILMLLALRFAREFDRSGNGREINWALVSFGLAAGTKPQLAAFGLPLLIWFLASPTRPWRAFCWRWMPLMMPVWLLCSPIPSFVMNLHSYGTFAGPGQDFSVTSKGPLWNWTAGAAMIIWQSSQPPVSPAGLLNTQLDEWTQKSGIVKSVPRFSLRVPVVAMVDSAALGLIGSVLFVIGAWLALRRRVVTWRSWQCAALTAGMVSLLIALSRIIAGSSGRIFAGFLYWALPLAVVGWNQLSARQLKFATGLSLCSAIMALVLTPSCPLWPAKWFHAKLKAHDPNGRMIQFMEPYFLFPERAYTARELVEAIPQTEQQFLVLAGFDRPLLPLFWPYNSGPKLSFLPPNAMPEEMEWLKVNFVVVGGGAEEFYPQLIDYLQKSRRFRLLDTRYYTSKIQRGAEPWLLYQRIIAPSP